jgi:SAM-dependent methyltransferase
MANSIRDSIMRRLSPRTIQYIRYWKWLGYLYLPHLIGSVFVRRTPELRGFAGGSTSESLRRQLRGVNVFAPTTMCHVMTRYGSDKGRWHNYTTIYSELFGRRRDEPLSILELGLGTNNQNLVSSMGVNGRPGASLRGWRELFPRALVYGADIDRDILFEDDRIKTFYCDHLDRVAIRELWSQPGLRSGADIIVDDGLHTFEANTSFLDESLEHLRPGGVYVVEDIVASTIERWREHLGTTYSKRFQNHEFALVILPNSLTKYDNNLLIARRLS